MTHHHHYPPHRQRYAVSSGGRGGYHQRIYAVPQQLARVAAATAEKPRTLFFSNVREKNTAERDLFGLARAFTVADANGVAVGLGITRDGEYLFADAEGHRFFNVQHYLEYKKAQFFASSHSHGAPISAHARRVNALTARAILDEKDPHGVSRYELLEYDNALWTKSNEAIAAMDDANRLKFQQNPALKRALLATGDAILAESSGPASSFYGNGYHISFILSARNLHIRNQPETWKGRNEFGKSLMRVRDELLGVGVGVGVGVGSGARRLLPPSSRPPHVRASGDLRRVPVTEILGKHHMDVEEEEEEGQIDASADGNGHGNGEEDAPRPSGRRRSPDADEDFADDTLV